MAVPVGIDRPADIDHVVGEVLAKTWVGQDVVTNAVGRWLIGRQDFKTSRRASGHGVFSPLSQARRAI